ncbi:MAG: hypothetical protein CVT88_08350 [Candidatus Altiarchaeales archaeon HGW-Altiarchaeales-1]|nr:MAG: hypothetical protein CVT88_08350 [Candidatus Altiarchaeales archaeon HGW-Altiarchaeales-1]PKP58898.1 MAG: hypothetical protein CVT89_02070 [Candidatus Altiarchaeales archaeon HGW-Altiarchaeales-2]
MCIIIDANALGLVFNAETNEHEKFKPVLDWINNGKGKIVYGGTKYETELIKAGKLKLIKLYNDIGKAVYICNKKVDDKQSEIEKRVNNPHFNDSHLVAIVYVSKCKLICSNDRDAYPFLKDSSIYQNEIPAPKIYNKQSFRKHKQLLNDSNIAECCKPCSRTTKKQRESLNRNPYTL